MNTDELLARVRELQSRLGPKAAVRANFRGEERYPFMIVYPYGQSSQTYKVLTVRTDWETAFAEAEAYIASLPNPDAEYSSWFGRVAP